jgi:uncharacterized protein
MTPSPCNKICTLNPSNICVGCGRSREEIATWSQLSDAEKKRVLELAASRLKSVSQMAAKA